MMNPLWTRLLAVILCTLFLSACGGGSPAQPTWLNDDAGLTSSVTVLDDGTQLVKDTTEMYLRASTGERITTVSLPRGAFSVALSKGDHFALYGITGGDVWRSTLSASGVVDSDNVIYSGTDLPLSPSLKQFGSTAILYWRDGDLFTWYSENDLSGGQYPQPVTDLTYTLTPDQHFWYVDPATTELVETDLNTFTELSRTPLDPEFQQIGRLYVNDGFAVGTLATDLHSGVDLIMQDRANQSISYARSFGGFGTFKLNMLGQDAQGNIYYYYFAAVAHSGFSTGMHVRAISNTNPEAWDYKIASSEPFTTPIRVHTLDSGLQMTHIGESTSLVSFGFERTSTSYYTHLAADKTVVDSFFLQPHSVLLPPGNASYPQLQELGYLVDRFATTASGVVYIYGRTGYSTTTPTTYFAAQY